MCRVGVTACHKPRNTQYTENIKTPTFPLDGGLLFTTKWEHNAAQCIGGDMRRYSLSEKGLKLLPVSLFSFKWVYNMVCGGGVFLFSRWLLNWCNGSWMRFNGPFFGEPNSQVNNILLILFFWYGKCKGINMYGTSHKLTKMSHYRSLTQTLTCPEDTSAPQEFTRSDWEVFNECYAFRSPEHPHQANARLFFDPGYFKFLRKQALMQRLS